jgi:hypothetical protein
MVVVCTAAALTECLPIRTKADIAAKAIARKVIPINVFFDFFMLCAPPEVFRTINQSDGGQNRRAKRSADGRQVIDAGCQAGGQTSPPDRGVIGSARRFEHSPQMNRMKITTR